MATNIYNSNHMQVAQYTAGADISSGDIVVIGSNGQAIVTVALGDIANGATGSVGYNCGVNIAKLDAAVIGVGETVSWDSSGPVVDDNAMTAGAGDVKGVAMRAEESKGATTGETIKVWLTGIPSALT